MRVLLQLMCLLSVFGCSGNGRDSSSAKTDGRKSFLSYDITQRLRCAPGSGLLGCLREHEPVDVRIAGIQPKRRDASICFPVPTKSVCFVDGDGLRYALLGQVRDQWVVVETEATGGYTVVLVDAGRGRLRRVDNLPLYSPTAGLFATVSYDTDAGYVQNRVAVWNPEQANPIYVFGDFVPGEGPTGIRWVAPLKLEVRYSREPYSPNSDRTHTFTIWSDGNGVWQNDYKR